jgi:hypothetical protein
MSTWSEASILFMPILIGVAVGWAARRCANSGGSGLAGFAMVVTLLAGVGGLAMQHQIEVNFYLQRMADAAYDETLNYSKRTATIQDANALRTVMATAEVSVIGRMAAREKYPRIADFWFNRNFIHLHWIASRRIVIFGQGGPERTILEASRVMDNSLFLDDVVTAKAKEPITDADISGFYSWEQPFLKQLAAGEISRDRFEIPLIRTVQAHIGWQTLVTGGFGPLSGMCIFWGCFAAYKIARRLNEAEVDYA